MNGPSTVQILALAGVLCSPTGFLHAEVITDTPDSAAYLAQQITISSGFPAENYLIYSRSLAQTLSLLNPQQQARVFGPGGSANSDTSNSDTSDSNSNTATQSSAPKPSYWEALLRMFREIFGV